MHSDIQIICEQVLFIPNFIKLDVVLQYLIFGVD